MKLQGEINELSKQSHEIKKRIDEIAATANANEEEMLKLIGEDHGVTIPTSSQIFDEEGTRYFSWGEEAKTESATKKRRASTKEKRAAKATEKAAAKKKA